MQLFPDRMIDLFHSDPSLGSVNIGGYGSPEFDRLAELLKDTFDEEVRVSILKEMQAFVTEDTPIVPLYYQEIVNAYNPSIYDGFTFQLGKGIIHKMSFVTLEGNRNAPPVSSDKEKQPVTAPSDTNTDNESSGASNSSLLIIGIIILGLVVGGMFIKKKSGGKKEDTDF